MKKYIIAIVVICIIAIFALSLIHKRIVMQKANATTKNTMITQTITKKAPTDTKAAGQLIYINSQAEFANKVLKSDKVSLVDFYATWCPPCRKLGPIIEKIAVESNGKFIVAKVDIDKNKELADKYGIASIPTIILFKNGKPIQKIVGYNSENVYTDAINKVLK